MMTRPATLQAAAETPQASAGNDAGEQAKPTAFAKLIDLLPGVTPDNLKSVKGLSPGVLADGLLAIVEDPGKVSDFDNTPLGRYLSALPTTLKTDLEQRRRIIDRWVDGTMTSLSVTYRRNARYWLVGIGLLIVLPLGIDSVWLAKRLYSEPTLRAAAVTEAQNTVNSTKPLADCEPAAPANQRGATTTTTAPPSVFAGRGPRSLCPQRHQHARRAPHYCVERAWWPNAGRHAPRLTPVDRRCRDGCAVLVRPVAPTHGPAPDRSQHLADADCLAVTGEVRQASGSEQPKARVSRWPSGTRDGMSISVHARSNRVPIASHR